MSKIEVNFDKEESTCAQHNRDTQLEETKERLLNIRRRVFASGAQRDSSDDKPFIHNLKGYTRQRFGYHMNLGSIKYGDGNWEKGMPTNQYLESMDRHLAAYMEGDRSEDHLSAIIFGINGIMQNEKKEGINSDYYFKLLNK